MDIKVRTKINLPEKLSTDESDLALLLSNLLENTINACTKQKSGEKIISVTIQSIERQCVLEIINSCGFDVSFDEKNYRKLPQKVTGSVSRRLNSLARNTTLTLILNWRGGYLRSSCIGEFKGRFFLLKGNCSANDAYICLLSLYFCAG
ncbi:MAG: GHKL domain-containing protein [Quinella sp. 3Q1]|nr:GHKL domain-containing protein [Quinella sp. 3Q1]MBR6887654.1 GHKL domain-containing protein [Selenomonadaceae bacterium]